MTEESRLGPAVRERTKLLAALLRTPDDKFLTYLQANGLPEGIDQNQLRHVRDVMDALGKGLRSAASDPFWRQLDALWSLLLGPPGAAAGPALGAAAIAPPPPIAAPLVVAPPPAAAFAPPAEPALDEPHTPLPDDAVTAIRRRDFRHKVMRDKPPQRAPSGQATAPDEWKPHAPQVRSPELGQLETAGVIGNETLEAGLDALRGALTWPLERIAQLCADLANQRAQGQPTIDEICRRFDLPTELILNNVMRLWQNRLDEDQELAREHARLVLQFRQNDKNSSDN